VKHLREIQSERRRKQERHLKRAACRLRRPLRKARLAPWVPTLRQQALRPSTQSPIANRQSPTRFAIAPAALR
jgi:hypothetical protein